MRRPRISRQLVLAATSVILITTVQSHNLFERASTCADSSFSQCTQAGLPSSFCCSPSTTCIPLAANTTVLCCPNGQDCATIQPITCDITQQNATLHPDNSLKTTALTTSLTTCGKACCPFGFSCNSDGNCAMNANQQESIPGTTASTTTSTTNPTSPANSATAVADSSCPSFPTDAVLAGFFPGLLVGIIIAVVGICIFGAKRRKEASGAGRRNSSSFGNISDPQPSADLRSDFLRRNPQSPEFMGMGMGMGTGTGTGTGMGMGMGNNPPGLQRAGTVQRVRSLFRKSTSTNNSHKSPNMQQQQSPAMPPIPLTVSKSPHTPSNYGANSEYGNTPVTPRLQREPSYEDINIFADGDTASALRERERENGLGTNSPPLLSPPVLRGGPDDAARDSNITSFGDMMEKSGGLAGLPKGQPYIYKGNNNPFPTPPRQNTQRSQR